ncbi:MAG: integrase [Anaerolineae bacterium]
MSSEERMTIEGRLKYLRGMRKRYEPASRVERGRLLDEMETVTGLHRKSLTRLLNGPLVRKRRRQQRGSTYGAAIDDALRVIAESVDYVCAERLTPNLVWLANHLAAHGELVATPELVDALGHISVSTVRRRLARLQQDQPRLPRQGPERANQVTRGIPMRRIPWDEAQPGHFEIDTVHHCGISASGDYIHSLQWIDGATGWSERVAVLGRSFRVMEDACRYILARLPFPVLELHPDNGSEFLNHHLLRFFRQQVSGAHLSRSRPYHKNDNRKVEQKNATLVRALIGYERLDTVEQTCLLNQLYDQMWLYYNFFQPVLHLVEKQVIPIPGQLARVERRFDPAQTPFDRLCATDAISHADRQRLQALRDHTNPRQLRQTIDTLRDQLFALPQAVPGSTQDVFQTLLMPTIFTKGEDTPVTLSIE